MVGTSTNGHATQAWSRYGGGCQTEALVCWLDANHSEGDNSIYTEPFVLNTPQNAVFQSFQKKKLFFFSNTLRLVKIMKFTLGCLI